MHTRALMLKAHKARQTVGARAWASDMVESNAAGRAYRAMKSLLGTIKADPQLAAVSALGLCASASEHVVCAGSQANREKREMIVLLSHDTPVISTPIFTPGRKRVPSCSICERRRSRIFFSILNSGIP